MQPGRPDTVFHMPSSFWSPNRLLASSTALAPSDLFVEQFARVGHASGQLESAQGVPDPDGVRQLCKPYATSCMSTEPVRQSSYRRMQPGRPDNIVDVHHRCGFLNSFWLHLQLWPQETRSSSYLHELAMRLASYKRPRRCPDSDGGGTEQS